MERKSTRPRGTGRGGFALVLALSMMAFVIMLLLSMTLLVRVETSNSSQALAQLRAKESARLALMMALGDLQRYAGPDQRVTARAEILGSARATENPYWTGVWDTANPNATPRWMVSWQDQSKPSTQSLELVGKGSVDNDPSQLVNAPIIPVQGQNITSDQIAWWISDEASKACLSTVPLNARADPSFLDDGATEALELQLASTQGLEELISGYDRFTFSEAESLARVSSIAQGLNLLGSSRTVDIDGEAAFHVFAPASYGILANVLPASEGDSGLMRDLSLFPRLLGTGVEEFLSMGETNADLQATASSGAASLRLFTYMQGLDRYPTLNDGDIVTPVLPILSNMMIAFTIRSESPVASNPNFYLRMRFFCEFWNPYTHSILMQNEDGDPYELELEITGLPEVTVFKTSGNLANSSPINIQNLLGDPSNAPELPLVIKLAHDYNLDWLPGQAKNWTGVDASTATSHSPYRSIQNDGKDWNDPAHNLGGSTGLDTGEPRLSSDIRHESYGTNEITVKVYLTNTADASDRRMIEKIEGLTYEPVSTRTTGYSNTHSGTTFGYHFVLRGPHFSAAEPYYFRGLWLHDTDPRNPSPSINPDWYLDFDASAGTGSAFVPVKNGISPLPIPLPSEINETTGNINTQVFRRITDRSTGSSGYYNKLWQDTPLFELPRERVLSLASLQHLYFHNERPFQVGNSWGHDGAVNTSAWFDRYYFSGISRNDTADDFVAKAGAPNPTLVNYDLEDGSDEISNWQGEGAADADAAREPASHFMVANRFNINSTSVSAWKAVLGSLRISSYQYLDYPEEDTSDLSTLTINTAKQERMFSRFSHSLVETYEATETPAFENSEPVAPSAFYRHGARRLTEQQLGDLAEDIVAQITGREQPFFSMEEFLSPISGVDESLLERAIADVLAPDGRQKWYHDWELYGDETAFDQAPIDIDHFSPGFLTQADVMTAIGPMLAPRSDTFKIRTRARSYSELGELEGTAAIEAIVQRTPEAIDSAAGNLGSTERKFKLLSIRWLNESEI